MISKSISRFLMVVGVAVLVGGCATDQEGSVKEKPAAVDPGSTSVSLRNTVWVPEHIEHQGNVKLVGGAVAWFEIHETGKVFGCSGVNRFSSQAAIDAEKGELSFAGGVSTLMAGPNLGYERKFTQTMNAIRKYSISGDILTVYNETGEKLATFKAGPDSVKKQK